MYYSAWERDRSSEATEDHLHWDSLPSTACTVLYWHGKISLIKRKRNFPCSEVFLNVFNIILLIWNSAQVYWQLWTSGKQCLLLCKLVRSCEQTWAIFHIVDVSNSNSEEIWRFGFSYVQTQGSKENRSVPNYTKQSKILTNRLLWLRQFKCNPASWAPLVVLKDSQDLFHCQQKPYPCCVDPFCVPCEAPGMLTQRSLDGKQALNKGLLFLTSGRQIFVLSMPAYIPWHRGIRKYLQRNNPGGNDVKAVI